MANSDPFTVVAGPTLVAEVNDGGADYVSGLNVASYNAGGTSRYAISWGYDQSAYAAGGSIDLAVYNFNGSTSQNISTSNPLAATTTNYNAEPVVTFLTAGASAGDVAAGWVVTADSTGAAGSYDTKAEVLTPSGGVVTNAFTANQNTAGDQLTISLAGLSDGRLAAVWESSSSGGSEGSIQGDIYNANGSAFVPEFSIQTSSLADTPQVVALGAGKMEVVWETQTQNNINDNHVYAAQVTYNPSSASTPTVVVTEIGSTTTGTSSVADIQFLPSVTALSGGGFAVAFGSYNNATTDNDLLGHIVTGTGAVHDFTIAASTLTAGLSNSNGSISTATLSNGNIVVAWLQYDNNTGLQSVEVQLIDQTGALIGTPHTVADGPSTQSNNLQVSVAALQNSEFVVSWLNDGGSGGNDYKVESEILTAGPVVTGGGSTSFTGGGPAVMLNSGVTVSDPLSIASATVSIGTGFEAGDTLNFTNTAAITGSYNSATGVLTLSSTGSVSAAQYQAALDLITYSFNPSNGDPTAGGTHTSRTIDWVVTDSAGASSLAVTSSLTTSHVAPTVTAGGSASFTSGGAAATLDSGLTMADVDSGGNLTGATVTIGSGYLTGDTLAVGGSALIGTSITAAYNATTHQLTLSGTDTIVHYQTALESITFGSSATDPTNGGTDLTRTINWKVTDGSTSNGTSAMATSTVNVQLAPVISSVTAATVGNLTDLDVNKVVTITVDFSNAVNVTGTPELQLNDGEVATYTGGTGTAALTFSYTVQPNDNSADLQVLSLLLSGGTIKDGAGHDAVLTNAAADLHLQVDTTAPAVSSISLAHSTPNNASSETFTVTFSENVTGVDFTDFTAVTSGTSDTGVSVNPLSGSVYTVTVNGVTGDGTLGLNLNSSGTGIADTAGNAISGGFTGSTYTVDHTAPVVLSIHLANGTPNNASSESFTVTFSESVTGVVASDFALTATNTLTDAGITSITGTGDTYTVTVGGVTGDGTLRLDLKSGDSGITDAAGNGATAGFTGGDVYTIVHTPPSVSSIVTVESSTNNLHSEDFTVTFSESVIGLNSSDFALSGSGTANTGITVTPVSGSVYTVTVNGVTGDGTLGLNLNSSGTGITDAAGNAISGGFTGPTYTVDHTPPSVTSVSVPANHTYIAGQSLDFTVNYSEAVTVTGTGMPEIALTLDTGGVVDAQYLSGSGTSQLTFRYTVTGGEADTNGVGVGSAIILNGGTVQDAAGNAAALTLNSVGSTAGVLVDSIPPTVTSITTSGVGITAGSGDLNASHVVTLTLNESEVVNVNTSGGTPTLLLNDGGVASYVSGSGTSALNFTYLVAPGDNTGDLVVDQVLLHGATIQDAAGNNATLPSGAINPAGTLQIDTLAPQITGVTASPANGLEGVGQSVAITVAFGEGVTIIGGTPTLALNDHGTATYDAAATAALHDATKLVFDYTVGVSDTLTSPLAVTGINLHGAAIDDLAGNVANLSNIATTFTGLGVDSSLLTANPDSNHVLAGQTVAADAAHGVLANDTDSNPADHVVVSAVDGLSADVNQPVAGAYGSLTLHADGSYSYTASGTVTGVEFDTFTYTASNGHSPASTSTLTIEVIGGNQNFVFVPSGGSATGGFGNTVLDGSAGNATLTAATTFNAHQTLIGGSGDTLNAANYGQDTFVFANNFGHETINNFQPAQDVIQLQQSQFGSLAAVMADIHQVGADSVLTLDASHVITITNTPPTSLTAADFHLV